MGKSGRNFCRLLVFLYLVSIFPIFIRSGTKKETVTMRRVIDKLKIIAIILMLAVAALPMTPGLEWSEAPVPVMITGGAG